MYNLFTMKLTELKRKYKNKWILARVTKEEKPHQIIEVKPLVVSINREEIYASMAKLEKGAHVATFYTGKIPPKGVAYTFYDQV